ARVALGPLTEKYLNLSALCCAKSRRSAPVPFFAKTEFVNVIIHGCREVTDIQDWNGALEFLPRHLCHAFHHGLQVFQHLAGMAFRLDFAENVDDLAIGANYKRSPRHALNLLAIHVLVHDYVEGIAD